jgi:hypothetical protein
MGIASHAKHGVEVKNFAGASDKNPTADARRLHLHFLRRPRSRGSSLVDPVIRFVARLNVTETPAAISPSKRSRCADRTVVAMWCRTRHTSSKRVTGWGCMSFRRAPGLRQAWVFGQPALCCRHREGEHSKTICSLLSRSGFGIAAPATHLDWAAGSIGPGAWMSSRSIELAGAAAAAVVKST